MARCVDGHETQAEDFCDKCGMPVVHDDPAPSPVPELSVCPNCGAPRQNHSLFCESCGYDYTTGALPQQDLRTELGLPPKEAGPGDLDLSQAINSSISDNNPPQESRAGSTPEAAVPDAGETVAPSTPVPPKQHIPCVAEVWVDPQWYAFQESTDPLPPQGPPRIVPIKDSALIGRHSTSRNINPDIDCESDAGCSRRQAYLTCADNYWYINDLESANGTFVADATDSLPDTPITARTQITPDMRIYVGAWTRIVVRPAIEEELHS